MRTFLVGLVIGTLIPLVVRAMPQGPNPRETISIGIADLSLGMAEDAVITKLRATGRSPRTTPITEEMKAKGMTSALLVGEDGSGPFTMIFFESGKLHSVKKSLLSETVDPEFAKQLYSALQEMESEGDSECNIHTWSGEAPNLGLKSASLRCGKKLIMFHVASYKSQKDLVTLFEELSAP